MKRLVVVDLNNILYRSFFGIPIRNHNNPNNVIRGLYNCLKKIDKTFPNSHLVLAKESSITLKRKEIYPEYKANRKPIDPILKKQIETIHKKIDEFKIPNISIDGYEADDVIGSLCIQEYNNFDEIIILSTDKDLLQFLNDKIYMYNIFKQKATFIHQVIDVFGVIPHKIFDFLSLVGDKADNIPGVKSVGPKTAAKLIEQFGTIDNLIDNIESIKSEKIKSYIKNNLENLKVSKKLVKIHTDLDLNLKNDDMKCLFSDLKDFV